MHLTANDINGNASCLYQLVSVARFLKSVKLYPCLGLSPGSTAVTHVLRLCLVLTEKRFKDRHGSGNKGNFESGQNKFKAYVFLYTQR